MHRISSHHADRPGAARGLARHRPRLPAVRRLLAVVSAVVVLGGCRGGDGVGEPLRFPNANDPDAFGLFLNEAPASAAPGQPRGTIDNVAAFPEAYYATIDPDGTRADFRQWRIANGFLTVDGQEAACQLPDCERVRARFRDTKDLGYGRDMTLIRNHVNGDVAVYVENYQVDAITGLPYGPLNAEALAEGDRSWNFGVNAIEFSSFPDERPAAPKFTKFYNFAGDGRRALGASGSLQHAVDLDSRGLKNMPTPCIVCHGGLGRTLVIPDPDDPSGTRRVLAPTLPGRTPGDVMANLQMLELDTFQFVDADGFRREDNSAAIAAINDAVLYTWRTRAAQRAGELDGEWDPTFAIELLENRYPDRSGRGDATRLSGRFNSRYVPEGWAGDDPDLYLDIVGPNCMVCHAMRGSGLNLSLNFADANRYAAYRERSDHLVFERGVMPLGLLNYANLWDDPPDDRPPKDTTALAASLGRAGRDPDGPDGPARVASPGAPVVRIAAPTIATGLDAAGASVDIPLSGRDSAFVDRASFAWSVSPDATARVVIPEPRDADGDGENDLIGQAVLRVTRAGSYAVRLEATGSETAAPASATLTVSAVEGGDEAPPAAASVAFYGANGILALFEQQGCTACHARNGLFDGIPLHYERCRGAGDGEDDFLYRSVLARVNLDRPLDSLLFRKPTNGATDLSNLQGSQIDDSRVENSSAGVVYHNGGYRIGTDENAGQVLGWILNGAPRGTPGPLPADAPSCLSADGA